MRFAHSLSEAVASMLGRSLRIAWTMGASQVPPPTRQRRIKSRSLTNPTMRPPCVTAMAPIFFCAMRRAASRQGVEASRPTTSRTTFLWIVAIRVLLAASGRRRGSGRCQPGWRIAGLPSSPEAERVSARRLHLYLAGDAEGAGEVRIGHHLLDRAGGDYPAVR